MAVIVDQLKTGQDEAAEKTNPLDTIHWIVGCSSGEYVGLDSKQVYGITIDMTVGAVLTDLSARHRKVDN